jgi:hypothetical protein
MSKPVTILQKNYLGGKAITDVEIAVTNPVNSRQIILHKTVQIDTGFDLGVHIRETEAVDLAIIGVKPFIGSAKLAGNVVAKAQYCYGYLQKIGGFVLPIPGIEITLVFQGTASSGLLGMEAIKNWNVSFDGPSQSFIIK